MRVTAIAKGKHLEDLAYFGVMETLPYSLDSPVWQNAQYLTMSGRDNAPMREKLTFRVKLELLRAKDNAPMREKMILRLAGYGWITKAR